MENNSKTVIVKDTEYKILVLPPSRSIKLLSKLTKIIGKPMAAVATKSGEDRTEMIPQAVGALIENLSEDVVLQIVKELMACVFVENKSIDFEKHFHGKLGLLMVLCKEVLEVNYSDFLDEISALMAG
jgi:hypothetical protein